MALSVNSLTVGYPLPLSRSFKITIKARAERDRRFRATLLSQGVETLLAGDVDTAKALIRNYINATLGFEALARRTGKPPKSLMRMFSVRGNPSVRNLSAVLQQLQRNAGMSIRVRTSASDKQRAE
jgi:DNA-binding phage protein